MKYVVAERDDTTVSIDCITDDPAGYASQFEPVDVVNGKMFAWDERGNRYEFGPSKSLHSTPLLKGSSIVDVGTWESDEPVLVKVAEGDSSTLRTSLQKYLGDSSSDATLQELIGRAEADHKL